MRVFICTNSKGYLDEGLTNGQSKYYNCHDDVLAKYERKKPFANYSQITVTYGQQPKIVAKPHSTDIVRRVNLPLKVTSKLAIDLSPLVPTKLKKQLDHFNFDIVILGSLCPFMNAVTSSVAKSQAIPKIAIYHTFLREYVFHRTSVFLRVFGPLIRKLVISYEKFIYNNCDLILVPSKYVATQLMKDGFRTPIKIHGRGIDVTKYNPKWRMSNNFSVHTLGRLSPEKGLRYLPFVARKIELPIRVTGCGSLEDQLRLEPLLNLLGEKNGQEAYDEYANNDIFVFLSTTDTYGQVVDEAMASGNVVVALNTGGHVERIEEGVTGFLCGSIAEIAEKILLLQNDTKLLRKMQKAARQSMLNNTWENNLKERIRICEELITITKPNREKSKDKA